jgi:hypothetical protein
MGAQIDAITFSARENVIARSAKMPAVRRVRLVIPEEDSRGRPVLTTTSASRSRHLVPAHAHVVLVGFVMFLIFGVALWLFPRAPKDDTRYSPTRVSVAYWILALATCARFVAEAARAWSSAALLPWIVVLGGLAQALIVDPPHPGRSHT